VRLGAAAAGRPVVVQVVEAEPLVLADGRRDHGQGVGVDGRPLAGHGVGGGPDGVGAVAQPGGQQLAQLGQRAQRGLLDPGHGAPGGGVQADRDRDRLLVVQQQRRQGRAGAQAVAAGRPGGRADLVAQGAQPLDVVADGPGGHAQPVGQLGPGPAGPGLQQRQQPQQPHRGLQHGASLPGLRNGRFRNDL
jgi:hypothetical protein